jgi:phosphoribosyl-AMP cyclohydrolase
MLEIINWEKMGGLIPVIVQDIYSKEVLMQAYANRQALELTIGTGFAHYYSRSRNKLWMKGETSGNTQRVKKVYVDCDGDSLLYVVEQKGFACHTGEKSCFFKEIYEGE